MSANTKRPTLFARMRAAGANAFQQVRAGNLWNSQSLLAAIVRAVALAAIGMFLVTMAVAWYVRRDAARLTQSEHATLALDVLKVAGAVVAGLGAAVALTVSYRKQREEEGRRDGERFEQAASQLGDTDGAVRIAGAYALARLADESDDYRRPIVQLLCAYLRLNRPGDVAVQQTICEILKDRLSGPSGGLGRWSDQRIDLHGVLFEEDVDFSLCTFAQRTRFDGAIFKRDASFVRTRFLDQTLFDDATFEKTAYFFFSQFTGTVLMNGARFLGLAAFNNSLFAKGLQANGTDFEHGAPFAACSFPNGVTFSNAKLGDADFSDCTFSRGIGPEQTDAIHDGAAYFRETRFGRAHFTRAKFRTAARFDGARADECDFEETEFFDGGSAVGAELGAQGTPSQLAANH